MVQRTSGVLLHITSLPGTPGIGTMGKSAYAFVDWLNKAHQSLWQVLPLGPTGYGDSPYASFSTFAGNPLLIDLDDLVERGWADEQSIVPPEYIHSSGPVDYGSVVWWKVPVLYTCAQYFLSHASKKDRAAFQAFKNAQSSWLDNFANFTSIKKFYDAEAAAKKVTGVDSMWNRFWPKALASHNEEAVSKWVEEHADDIEQIKVIQFFFDTQWQTLKKYANKKGIKIIGDIPIFVAGDSADVWASQHLFQIDKKTLLQKAQAGVPPDYFSATGQLWGNPLYDWKAMKKENYAWWVSRIQNMLRLVDIVRIDHFRGFEAYWSVPANEETAVGGKWVKGPGKDLFDTIKAQLGTLPIIAEDLGVITDEVAALRDGCDFPGMKILQFAFSGEPWNADAASNAYLPHSFDSPRCVVYTGTHDNDTTMGILQSGGEGLKKNICAYLNLDEHCDLVTICHALVRLAFASSAQMCVVPLQDVYNIGSEGRMNTPSTTGSNWAWRMSDTLLDERGATELAWYASVYGRNND